MAKIGPVLIYIHTSKWVKSVIYEVRDENGKL